MNGLKFGCAIGIAAIVLISAAQQAGAQSSSPTGRRVGDLSAIEAVELMHEEIASRLERIE